MIFEWRKTFSCPIGRNITRLMGPAGKLRGMGDFLFLHDQADGCFKLVHRRIEVQLFIGSVQAAMTLGASWLDQPAQEKEPSYRNRSPTAKRPQASFTN
jgi:hypothetical protein